MDRRVGALYLYRVKLRFCVNGHVNGMDVCVLDSPARTKF